VLYLQREVKIYDTVLVPVRQQINCRQLKKMKMCRLQLQEKAG